MAEVLCPRGIPKISDGRNANVQRLRNSGGYFVLCAERAFLGLTICLTVLIKINYRISLNSFFVAH